MENDLQQLMKDICDLCYARMPGASIAIGITDDKGTVTVSKEARGLAAAVPRHFEHMLMILNAMYYQRYVDHGDTEEVVHHAGNSGSVQ